MLYEPNGCKQCNNSGYTGRLAVHELLAGSPSIKLNIKEKESVERIREIATEEGMRSLRMDGISKTIQSIIEFEQVRRVCS